MEDFDLIAKAIPEGWSFNKVARVFILKKSIGPVEILSEESFQHSLDHRFYLDEEGRQLVDTLKLIREKADER